MKYTVKPEVLLFTPEEPDGLQTVSDFLNFFYLGRKTRYLLIQNRQITVNDETIKSDRYPLRAGDLIRIEKERTELDYRPADRPASVVYENDLIYVCHKEAGTVVHDPDDSSCLASLAARWLQDRNLSVPVRYIHRLDRETSGLVLFVKEPFFQPRYDFMMKEKQISRIYEAIVKGPIRPQQTLTFHEPIGKDRHRSGFYRVSSTGKDAKTHVTCLSEQDGVCLIRCVLETGRTHQIRVHCSAHGLPIVNDNLYGVKDSRFRSMGLWAAELIVPDLFTSRMIEIKDPIIPGDFQIFR